jgi:chromate transport protein ChrA
MWLLSLAVVSVIPSTIYHNNSAYFGVLARTLKFFGVLMIAGAIPSGVIALVVSWFAHRAPQRWVVTMIAGTVSGVTVGILWLPVPLALIEFLGL